MAYTKEGYWVSGVLNEADAERFEKAAEKLMRKYRKDKKAAQAALIRSGIYTPDGKIAEEYSQ